MIKNTIIEEKVFMPYQIDVIRDEHIAQLVEKGRQEGLSWAFAYKSYKWSGKEGRYPTFFATKTRILAKQFINDCAAWAKLDRLIKSTVDATYEDQIKIFNDKTEEEETVNTYNIRFPNKMEVTALSSNADAMRGWRGYKIADEFAIHKQQAEMLDAILPSRMWRYPFAFVSTHKGINSEFNKIIKKYKGGLLGVDWNLISIPIQRAVADGLLEKIYKRPFTETERQDWLLNLEREEGQRRWKQEYCCIPEDEAGAFFSYDLLIACESEELLYDDIKKFTGAEQEQDALKWFESIAEAVKTKGAGSFYLGMDIGRDINYTVLCLIEEVAGIKFIRALAALEKMRFQVQQDCARILIRMPRFRRSCVDNRGMGRETVERLQGDFGPYLVEKIDFNLVLKEKIAYAVYQALTDRMLKIPVSDTVRDDFHSIRKETTDAGNVRYVASQNQSDPNSHGDYYTAISLALHATGVATPDIPDAITTNEAPIGRNERLDTLLQGYDNSFRANTMTHEK
jgi:phage FluMu gp28-like protein